MKYPLESDCPAAPGPAAQGIHRRNMGDNAAGLQIVTAML
jgi:hypothetical protein